nr:hypothetical protein CPGR_00526 [Mycolicibacterium malmesburyense]
MEGPGHRQLSIDPHAHVERRAGGEDLEDRACAVADERERLWLHRLSGVLVQAVVAVAGHRQHPMRILARLDDAHHAGDSLQRRARDLVDRSFHRSLDRRIERRPDQVATAGDLLLADPGVGQICQRVLAEEPTVTGGDASAREFFGPGQHSEGGGFGGSQVVGMLGEVFDHGVQHQVSPLQSALRVDVGVQRRGRLNQAGQQRGLLPVQLGCVDPEVGLRGVLNTERSVPESDEVQVARQDLRLGERLVQRQRHPHLTQLARRRQFHRGSPLGVVLGGHQELEVLHVLLLDR